MSKVLLLGGGSASGKTYVVSEVLKRLPKEVNGCNAKRIIDKFINDFK